MYFKQISEFKWFPEFTQLSSDNARVRTADCFCCAMSMGLGTGFWTSYLLTQAYSGSWEPTVYTSHLCIWWLNIGNLKFDPEWCIYTTEIGKCYKSKILCFYGVQLVSIDLHTINLGL